MEKLAIAKEPVRVAVIEAENFKKFKTFYLELGKHSTTIGGDNGAGKSSVADIVRALIGDAKIVGGKKSEILEPLRRGAESGEVKITLDNGITIEKHITKGGISQAIIRSPERPNPFPTPAHLLAELIGDQALAFDPAAIKDMDNDQFREYLERALGLDFTDIGLKIATLYDQRTDYNRTVKEAQAQLQQYPEDKDCPKAPAVVNDLMRDLEEAQGINAGIRHARAKLDDLRNKQATLEQSIDELTTRLGREQVCLTDTIKAIEEGEAQFRLAQPADELSIREKIGSAQEINDRIGRKEARDLLIKRIKVHQASSDDCTKEMRGYEEARRNTFRMAMENIKVKDMAVRDDGTVTLKGSPFRKGQVSDTEIVKVGVAIWRALNPTLRTMIVDNGEKLDITNHAALCRAAVKYDFQPIIIRVSQGPECSIILEEGVIKDTAEGMERPRVAPHIMVEDTATAGEE